MSTSYIVLCAPFSSVLSSLIFSSRLSSRLVLDKITKEYEEPRRLQLRECQNGKKERFYERNNRSARSTSHFFCTFLDVHCTTTTRNFLSGT